MEDITAYGEISGHIHHKGDTHPTVTLVGLLCLLAGAIWILFGCIFVFKGVGPFFDYADTLSEPDPLKTLAFLALGFVRPAFGGFLIYLAFQLWDMQNGARKWAFFLLPLPVVYFVSALMDLPESFAAEVFSYRYVVEHFWWILFLVGLVFTAGTWVGALGTGAFFKVAVGEKSWLVVGAISLAIMAVLFGLQTGLSEPERAAALRYGLPVVGSSRSGTTMIDLDIMDERAIACQENMALLKKAADERAELRPMNFGNFKSAERGRHLMEILRSGGNLSVDLRCPEGGDYTCREDRTWKCSIHGAYDAKRLEEARSRRFVDTSPGEATSDEDTSY